MTDTASVSLRVRYRLTPWWVRVIVIFALSRIITTIFLLVLAHVQGPNPWTGASPGYFDFASIWDGRWYDIVAGWGYPPQLPMTAAGHVAQNAWAFLPGYPAVVGAVMFVARLPWAVAAVLVSLGFGLAGALVFYRLMRLRLNSSTSMFAVVLLCVAPLSPMLQLAYAESMYQFLLILALYLLVGRKYLLLLPLLAVMGFTRPSGLAFALALGLHVVYRWVVRRRDPFPAGEQAAAIVATAFSVVMGLAWPAIAGIVTGSPFAYFNTELAWRADYIGYQPLTLFTPWFQGAAWWFTTQLHLPAWLGYLSLIVLIAAFAAALFSRAVRRLGVDIRLWLASYALYLLAVFFPQSSTFRMLMPMVPLVGAAAVGTSRSYRILLVCLCVAGQLGWLLICWGFDGYDWTPP